MASEMNYGRTPWEDEFTKPTLEVLLSAYQKPTLALFEGAREKLMSFEGMTEELDWQGLPWRWCLIFRHPSEPDRGFAYLVPDPEMPRICVPVTRDMVKTFPMHRIKKHIRERLSLTQEIDGVFWTTYDLTGRPQLDDTMDLAKRKFNFLKGQQQPAS